MKGLEHLMTGWRHDLHRHPEFGFKEMRTAAFVAETLRSFGVDVAEGVGGTGVVGTLTRGTSNRSIALRADMDALQITEATGKDWTSAANGLMHACGHDGHVSMLLGAAKMLAQQGNFDGTIRFLFQPAEEWGRGALAMLDDGLMDRFPFEEVFGLHNMPGVPVGRVEVRSGPMMSAEDIFEITLTGQGGHASQPQSGREVMVPACALVMELQTIVSRRLSPSDTAVVSVTEFLTDGTRNALPGHARILGDARSFDPAVSAKIEEEMRRIAAGVAAAHDLEVSVRYDREFIPLINDADLTTSAAAACVDVSTSVVERPVPLTASEDFAQFLQHVPGSFVLIGNGEESSPLHSPTYDFNDSALMHGAQVYTAIAQTRLNN